MKMNAYTQMAIWGFEKVCRKEKQLEKAKDELSKLMKTIPQNEIPEYFTVTEQIRQRLEA